MRLAKGVKVSVSVVLTIFLLIINLSACSIPGRKPQEGIWRCEELMIEIDCNYEKNNGYYAKILNSDGNWQKIRCRFDYGTLISLCSEDQQTDYLTGNFHYEYNLFLVTTVDKTHTYVFKRIDE